MALILGGESCRTGRSTHAASSCRWRKALSEPSGCGASSPEAACTLGRGGTRYAKGYSSLSAKSPHVFSESQGGISCRKSYKLAFFHENAACGRTSIGVSWSDHKFYTSIGLH